MGEIQHGTLPGTTADVHAAEVANLMPMGRKHPANTADASAAKADTSFGISRKRCSAAVLPGFD